MGGVYNSIFRLLPPHWFSSVVTSNINSLCREYVALHPSAGSNHGRCPVCFSPSAAFHSAESSHKQRDGIEYTKAALV